MRGDSVRPFVQLVLVAVWLGAGAAAAQVATGTLTGLVTAADGARLPGVTVRLVHEGSGATELAVSSDAGLFRVGDLAPGVYRLEAELAGFEPRRLDEIIISRGATRSIDVQLDVALVRETVSVVGVVPRDAVKTFEMRESRARDLGEALAALPGVTKVRRGAIANDLVVRGFSGKDVTVLIDGQRLDGACPNHMDPPAFHVDFAEVDRVELSRGPFDVKNQGGMAGIVNVVTERPQRGLHASGDVTIGSAATLASSATASAGRSGWAALGGASMRRAHPYEDGSGVPLTGRANYRASAVEDLPAYDAWTAWGRVALVPRPGTTVQVSYTRQSADEILYPYLQMDAVFDNADRAGVGVEVAELPGGWKGLAANLFYTHVDHWMTDQFRTSAGTALRGYSMGTRAKTAIFGGRAEIGHGALTVGVEASRRNWIAETSLAARRYEPQASLPDVTIGVAGVFGAVTADLGRQWRLDAGARLDYAETQARPTPLNSALYLAHHGTTGARADDLLPSAHVRANWRRDGGLSGMLGVGYVTRLPDQQERFFALARMGSDWVGNPSLAPSRNTGFDGEVRYTGHGFDAAFAAYVYRIDDHIRVVDQARRAMVPGVMNAMARSFANVDALMRGLEASATVPLASALYLSADASVVRGTSREADLPEIPPARARVRLRYDRASWNALAEVVGAARQDHVAPDLRESPTPGFVAINLSAGLRWRHVSLTAGLDNVFDALYAEHLSYQRDPFRNGVRVYEPGRTLLVHMGVQF